MFIVFGVWQLKFQFALYQPVYVSGLFWRLRFLHVEMSWDTTEILFVKISVSQRSPFVIAFGNLFGRRFVRYTSDKPFLVRADRC